MDAITLQKNTPIFEKDSFDDVLKVLDNDGILLFPTDTIWSIGCDATNPLAIERIKRLKRSDNSQSFVLLVNNLEMLKEYVEDIHPRLETLMFYHTRPLTVVYNQPKNLPYNILAINGSIAARLTHDPFCRHLTGLLNRPLLAAFANINEAPFPTIFGEISSEIIQGVDYVARHKRHDKTPKQPAVVVKFDGEGELTFLRE